MTGPHDIVIVGASAAGLRAAQALRAEGYSGALTITGAGVLSEAVPTEYSKHLWRVGALHVTTEITSRVAPSAGVWANPSSRVASQPDLSRGS